jgi:hypothetical protein
MQRVDASELERDTEAEPARACLAEQALAFDGRPRRFDADNANVEEIAPPGQVSEQPPHDIDRCLNDFGGASYLCGHQV